jgi:hypothetical protein
VAWQFILSDLLGNTHGEVTDASERKVGLPHLRVPSASFKVPIYHYLAPYLLDTDCLLRCYRVDDVTGQRDLAFHGPVVSAEESAEESNASQSIAVTAAGPYWRLAKRLIPSSKLATGIQYGGEGAELDLGAIARTVLFDVNAAHFTGIDLGSHTNSISGWVGPWYLKNASEAIAELAAGLNSFEFRVSPTEATGYANPQNWPRIGLLDTAPILGTLKPDAIFEYGTGRANVASYKRQVGREGLLTQAMCSVSGWPDSIEKYDSDPGPGITLSNKYSMVEVGDTTAINARGLFEEVVNDAGILDDGLRTNLAQFHVDVRKNPRQIITFKPRTGASPRPFVDYNVGDSVRARAVVSGTLRFDALFRIWGITFDVDGNGNESIELELVMP